MTSGRFVFWSCCPGHSGPSSARRASTLIQPVIQAMSFGLDARSMGARPVLIHPAMPELIENALLNLPLD